MFPLIYDEFPDYGLFGFEPGSKICHKSLSALKSFGLNKACLVTSNHFYNSKSLLFVFKKANTSNLNIIQYLMDNNIYKDLPKITLFFSETLSCASGWGNRKWIALKGNLHLSLLLKPEIPFNKKYMNLLRVIVFNSLENTLKEHCDLQVKIKLPSDILINRKKIGGVIERGYCGFDIKSIVFGIGLNINNLPVVRDIDGVFISGVQSLSNITGRTHKLGPIIISIISAVQQRINMLESDPGLLDEDINYFNSYLYGINEHLVLFSDQDPPLILKQGIFHGISEDGILLFQGAELCKQMFESSTTFRIPI